MAEEKRESRYNRRQGFLIGLAVGAVAGSMATLWVSGKVRRQMRQRGISVDRAGDFVTSARERGGEFMSRVRTLARQATEEGKKAAEKTRSDMEERFKKEGED